MPSNISFRTEGAADAEMPFVSVVMPIRGEEDFIERSLRAVLGQTYPSVRMEVFVADGMSTDSTRERVRAVATEGFGPGDENDIRRRLQERLGPAVAVRVEPVERIARTPAGKFRAVISQVKPDAPALPVETAS
ncbi:MAG: glycosyltransferase [Thermoanaerobaculia bacterium]